MYKLSLWIFLFLTSSYGLPIGEVIKYSGDVKIQKGILKKNVTIGEKIESKDILLTDKNGLAILKLNDNSKIILSSESRLIFNDPHTIVQKEGKIFYSITKRSTQGLKVTTDFAIIGVKGTEFIITSLPQKQECLLNEGSIDISSLEEEFELHEKKQLDEFHMYEQKVQNDYENYVKKESENFIQFVKTFELTKEHSVIFDKLKVFKKEFNKIQKDEFTTFHTLLP